MNRCFSRKEIFCKKKIAVYSAQSIERNIIMQIFKQQILIFTVFLVFVSHLNSQNEALSDTLSINLLFVGDIMGHDSQIKSAEVIKDSLYDYSPCYEFVKPIIQNADLAIGNLEVTLPGKPPYKGYPRFRSPEDLALALRYAGFDLLVTSNNHSNDAGANGVINTITTLDDYGFYHTGTFLSKAEKDAFYPLIVYKQGFKLIFLNYTYGTNGLPTRKPTVVNLIDEKAIEKDMEMARLLEPDAMVVIMHWGNEYQLIESSSQRKLNQKLYQWGADLVIGAHPHVVQPIKENWFEPKEGSKEKKLTAYSLGNFVSGQRRLNTDGGLILEVELKKDRVSNKTFLGKHHYIPVWRYIEKGTKGKQTFRILPISVFENTEADSLLKLSKTNRAAMMKFAQRTRKHLKRFDSSERKITLQEISSEEKHAASKTAQ